MISYLNKMALGKKIALSGAIILLSIFLYSHQKGGSMPPGDQKKSKYEIGMSKLGFTYDTQQEALLRIFYLAGYLNPENIWADINRIGGIPNPEQVFASIYCSLVNAHAVDRDDTPLDTKYLKEHFLDTELITDIDAMDLVLYIAQHAFNREVGQERRELRSNAWMTDETKIHEYMTSAKALALVDALPPKLATYDFAWIFGASRLGVLARITEYQYLLHKGLSITGPTQALAGDRELWAEIDGIDPVKYEILKQAITDHSSVSELPISCTPGSETVEEKNRAIEDGKAYLKYLANKHGIHLNQTAPFIIKNGRTYANSIDGKKLTETMMAQDLLENFLSEHQIITVDTVTHEGGDRPNTSTTAFDAAKKIIALFDDTSNTTTERVLHGLTISNQPFAFRQKLAAQQAADEASKDSNIKIILDVAGAQAQTSVVIIHSELGALFAEMHRSSAPGSTRSYTDLLFQSRNRDSDVPPMPDLSTIDCMGSSPDLGDL